MKKICLIILILISLVIPVIFANYPVIITSQGMNHTMAKELVYSVPVEYYKSVDYVEFIKNYRIESFWVENRYSFGYAQALWDSYYGDDKKYCYEGYIKLEYNVFDDNDRRWWLLHELGHIDEMCVSNHDNTTDLYADSFAEQFLRNVMGEKDVDN